MTTVVLQRGHVPRRSGATGAPGEQQFARDVAAAAAPLLRDAGFAVRVIDADEHDVRYRGDLFFAIHYDSSGDRNRAGASVGYQTVEGRRLAGVWKRAYVAAGYRRAFLPDNYTGGLAGYYGVRKARAQGNRAAIICEFGFGSHRTEGPWLRSPDGVHTAARSLCDAALTYTGRTPREDDDVALTEQQQEALAFAGQLKAQADRIGTNSGFLPRVVELLRIPAVARALDSEEGRRALDRAIDFAVREQAELDRLNPPTNPGALRTLIVDLRTRRNRQV